MVISPADRSLRNISKISIVFSFALICPTISLAEEPCCSIPEESSPVKSENHISFAKDTFHFYPSGFEKAIFEKYALSINDYNRHLDKFSTKTPSKNSSEITQASGNKNKVSFLQNQQQQESHSGLSWINDLYEKFLSPETAEASDERTISSYAQLRERLNIKHSFESNRLVAF